jgi:hypothetical protein
MGGSTSKSYDQESTRQPPKLDIVLTNAVRTSKKTLHFTK